MSQVVLAFPPVVETNFGAYYPSTAYLAASLMRAGHEVRQLDLNEAFALWLAQPEQLARFGVGDFTPWDRRAPETLESVAARVLEKNRSALFDDSGRHMFSDQAATPGYLLHWLASAFRVDDLPQITTTRINGSDPLVSFWEKFAAERLNYPAPDLFGVSIAMGPQILPGLCLAKAARDAWPQSRIVLGGPAISLMDEADLAHILRQCSFVDAAVRFDGERPLSMLASGSGRGSWCTDAVPSVTVAKADSNVAVNAPDAGLSLALLPFAHYDPELLSVLHDPVFGVVQARGCYWGECAYCDFVELYKGSPKFRQRPLGALVEEIESLTRKHNGRRFSLITEALPPAYARRLAETLIERRTNVMWSSFVMVHDLFDRALFERLVRSGCERLVVGMETMNDRVLALVGKHAGAAGNEAFLDAAAAAGIALTVNLIPDLPSTTAEEAMAALNRLEALADRIDTVSVFPFEATRSSAIGRNPEHYGLVHGGHTANQAQYAANGLDWSDPAMTPQERAEVHARYFSFAQKVNGRRVQDCDLSWLHSDQLVVDLDGIDIYSQGKHAQIFDWRRRDLVILPSDLTNHLNRFQTGQVLDRGSITRTLGEDRTNALFRVLVETGAVRRLA